MIADLYDFDKTVFNGESGSEFWLFCLKRHPRIIKYIPKQLKGLLGHYVFHSISKKKSKENIAGAIGIRSSIELFHRASPRWVL